MTDDELTPEEYIKQAYLGEFGGEETFRAWAELLPKRAESLNLLAEVEAATAAYLKKYLLAAVDDEEVERLRKFGRERAQEIAPATWSTMLDMAEPIIDEALVRFKAAEATAPLDLKPVYEHYTAHEQALADFIKRERDGLDGNPILQKYLDSTALLMS